jgi:hypothetical protein
MIEIFFQPVLVSISNNRLLALLSFTKAIQNTPIRKGVCCFSDLFCCEDMCCQNDVKVEIFYIMPLFLLFSFLFSMMLFRAQHADHKRPNDDEYHSQSSVVLNAEINPDVEFRVELIELLNELKNTVF